MTAPTNTALGERLGVSHATISRWKSGDRLPELASMERIKDVLGWSLDDQTTARNKGTYANEFSRRIERLESGDPVGAVGEAASPDQ